TIMRIILSKTINIAPFGRATIVNSRGNLLPDGLFGGQVSTSMGLVNKNSYSTFTPVRTDSFGRVGIDSHDMWRSEYLRYSYSKRLKP
ncbi:MAG: hypothetical protein ACE5H1_10310, partial [Thermodesulfobacteriota bacterium]